MACRLSVRYGVALELLEMAEQPIEQPEGPKGLVGTPTDDTHATYREDETPNVCISDQGRESP